VGAVDNAGEARELARSVQCPRPRAHYVVCEGGRGYYVVCAPRVMVFCGCVWSVIVLVSAIVVDVDRLARHITAKVSRGSR